MKLSSATRSSPRAGQPKLTRASLLPFIPGTGTGRLLATGPALATGRRLVMGATSSCMASAPSSPRLLKLTWMARNLPSGLNAPLTAELAPGSAMAVCRPVARSSTRTWHSGAHCVAQATRVALAAMTPSKDRLAWAVAGFHSVETGVPG